MKRNEQTIRDLEFSRRDFLRLGLAGAAGIFVAPHPFADPVFADDKNPLSGANLFRDVVAYSDLGEHRTATEIDLKTAEWIAKELKSAGFATNFQSFTVKQFFPTETSLKIGGKNFAAFPLWFPNTTKLLRAPLRKAGEKPDGKAAHIALVRFPFDARASIFKSSGHKEIIDKTIAAGATGIVAVTEGATGEIIGLNAMLTTEPWAVPILCVGGKDAEKLEAEAAKNSSAEIVLQGKTEAAAEAKNVVGKFGKGKKTILVSTPQSGWFRCAGERGAGVAMFLGLARWAAKSRLDANWIFVSTSGHEFGGLGMKAFLEKSAPKKEDVFAWLHLGANFAVWNYEKTPDGLRKTGKAESRRGIPAAPELTAPLSKAFQNTGLSVTARAIGEVELLLKDGYRAFGLVGANAFHHVPTDLPDVTAPELLEPVGAALVKSFAEIFATAK
ncbi:MAG: hypothetical protein AVDCRST_MAG74-972 [uncultured Pyrinomonadaceae bacterium]|uniref:PA domain-containing protein n=1 Tax=uncultured Pyrinomonadaceae bacterium TaxID=2283094 RepID=A0A6J4NP27_9BACT|nr:MAG: hypothetical protein AVDCRST_MAG74-972 [uncultured Pyrinomonadaceae bacterium]